ncbi:MAG: bifunctional UDP-N-acetylglucosamine diphosphorylase/glucosamine-1-phosphate N-acetyltransferase GlmU, partial [Porticoccus sp.]|nr:bifunctional UDP-N-acetylglucosamine diphosphorylase/glucosamine-1-phosphate N-acetyltransferase GlmU [Porticoccus sp.]
RYIEQTEQLGTAHAVLQAASLLDSEGVTLILYGDVPLISSKTIAGMLHKVSDRSMSLLTVQLTDPTGYGRIVRDDNGKVMAIVEQKDASREQLQISEVNTGVLALPSHCLQEWLPQIGNENAQGEYYLTDIISIARNAGFQVETLQPQSIEEVEGVNNRLQLNNLERYYQKQQAERLMAEGVTLADATRIDVRGNLRTGTDNFIDINAVFEGDVSLGSNIKIGPNCLIINSTVADGVEIKANSVIEECRIGKNAVIGPFARLRPGTELAEGVKVGNFVETKKVRVGKGSKISHLSYIGDAELGDNVNVGAGTITCNYDGVNKHQTTIGDNAFIGSNTSLVAPVVVGRNATVGAGSTINKDVPENKLGLTRAKQRNISDWTRPSKKN